MSELKRTFNPCDECRYGIDRRDGSGSDSTCKICEFTLLLNRRTQPGDGLKVKYNVFKVSDGSVVHNCFVLRPDKDPAAVAALRAYAAAIENKALAADIMQWVGPPDNAPLTLEDLRGMDNERVFVLLDDDVCIPALVAYNTEDCNNEDEEDTVYLTNNLGGRSTYEDMLDMEAKFYRRKPEGGDKA